MRVVQRGMTFCVRQPLRVVGLKVTGDGARKELIDGRVRRSLLIIESLLVGNSSDILNRRTKFSCSNTALNVTSQAPLQAVPGTFLLFGH